MIKREWQVLSKGFWFKVVLCAIVLIPTIYSCIFLGSMWDPYGNAKNIPVAIVNLDQEVLYNGKTLAMGGELVTNLKENKSMDFQFVNQQEADDGLKDGAYYMKITIPKDFSKCATTLLEDTPQKMVIEYTTNPGSNYIASKMDESAISKIKENISDTITKTYASTIFNQIATVSNGLKEAGEGSNKIEQGANQLFIGSQMISHNLQTLSNSSLTFVEGTKSLDIGLNAYVQGVSQLYDGSDALKNGIDVMATQTPALTNGVQQLQTGATTLSNGVTSYVNGVTSVYNGGQQLVTNNENLNNGMKTLQDGIEKVGIGCNTINMTLKTKTEELQKQLTDGRSTLQALKDNNSKTDVAANSLLTSLQGQKDQINKANEASTLAAINASNLTLEQKTAVLTTIQTMQATNDILSNQGLLTNVSTLAKTNNTTIDTFSGNLTTLKTELDKVTTGLDNLEVGLMTANESLKGELVPAITSYTDGAMKLQQGLSTLQQQSPILVNSATSLSDGLQQIKQKVPTLSSGIQELETGAASLNLGAGILIHNNQSLLSGMKQLTDGSQAIQSGSSALYSGSSTLTTKLSDMQEGANTLTTSLQEGASQSDVKISQNTIDMVATPVTTNHQEISVVENNGQAMAPYMMSVAMYVACMAFTLMYPLLKNIKEAKSGLQYWLSKASVMYSVSTMQALLMVMLLMTINGLQPQQVVMTFLFACVVSAAFMSIIVFFNITLGKIGSFLVLVFMVLQLGGAAGTYPLETSNTFYQIIHPLMPFSYSVSGFRHTLSMQSFIMHDMLFFIIIFMVFSIASIVFYQYRIHHQQTKLLAAFD